MRRRRHLGYVIGAGVGSAGLAAGGIGGPLLAADVAHVGWSGAPVLALVLGQALSSAPAGAASRRWGRPRFLRLAYGGGAIGALVVVTAGHLGSLWLLLAGSVGLGCGNTAVFLTRYAAADAAPGERREVALGHVMSAIAVGAVLGPMALGALEPAATHLGLPRYTALHALAVVAFALGAALVPRAGATGRHGDEPRGCDVPRPRRPLVVLGVANLAMVGVMTVAPVQLHRHGSSAAAVGAVVAVHVALMFAPSPITARLASAHGAHAAEVAGLTTIGIAGVVAVCVSEGSLVGAVVTLAILGGGWNLAVVGAGAELVSRGFSDPGAEALGEVTMGAGAAAGATLMAPLVAAAGTGTAWLAVVLVSVAVAGAIHRGPGPSRGCERAASTPRCAGEAT